MIYRIPAEDDPLTQGDIFDDCPVLEWAAAPAPELQRSGIILRIRAIVLTQACDLAESKATSVVLALVHDAQTLLQRGILKAALIRDQVRRHRVYGWYFLPAGKDMRESIVDLRHLHTVPRDVLDRLIREGKRLTRLTTPYREHLAQHFATTYSRIGLPELRTDGSGLTAHPLRTALAELFFDRLVSWCFCLSHSLMTDY